MYSRECIPKIGHNSSEIEHKLVGPFQVHELLELDRWTIVDWGVQLLSIINHPDEKRVDPPSRFSRRGGPAGSHGRRTGHGDRGKAVGGEPDRGESQPNGAAINSGAVSSPVGTRYCRSNE